MLESIFAAELRKNLYDHSLFHLSLVGGLWNVQIAMHHTSPEMWQWLASTIATGSLNMNSQDFWWTLSSLEVIVPLLQGTSRVLNEGGYEGRECMLLTEFTCTGLEQAMLPSHSANTASMHELDFSLILSTSPHNSRSWTQAK
jgi:hypothetical protein